MKGDGIAYKTGTSYGYRDAWAVGFDGRLVIGVWVGRPDGTAVPDLTGRNAAAPILFRDIRGCCTRAGETRGTAGGAPRQVRCRRPWSGSTGQPGKRRPSTAGWPSIIFPPDGSSVVRAKSASGELRPVVLKLQGGTAPFIWLVDGRPSRRLGAPEPSGMDARKLRLFDIDRNRRSGPFSDRQNPSGWDGIVLPNGLQFGISCSP